MKYNKGFSLIWIIIISLIIGIVGIIFYLTTTPTGVEVDKRVIPAIPLGGYNF